MKKVKSVLGTLRKPKLRSLSGPRFQTSTSVFALETHFFSPFVVPTLVSHPSFYLLRQRSAIRFTTYERVSDMLQEGDGQVHMVNALVAGTVAGAAESSTCLTPLQNIQIRMTQDGDAPRHARIYRCANCSYSERKQTRRRGEGAWKIEYFKVPNFPKNSSIPIFYRSMLSSESASNVMVL